MGIHRREVACGLRQIIRVTLPVRWRCGGQHGCCPYEYPECRRDAPLGVLRRKHPRSIVVNSGFCKNCLPINRNGGDLEGDVFLFASSGRILTHSRYKSSSSSSKSSSSASSSKSPPTSSSSSSKKKPSSSSSYSSSSSSSYASSSSRSSSSQRSK